MTRMLLAEPKTRRAANTRVVARAVTMNVAVAAACGIVITSHESRVPEVAGRVSSIDIGGGFSSRFGDGTREGGGCDGGKKDKDC